jgi:DNA-directed RNA polymerase specialized sigma24 family protein
MPDLATEDGQMQVDTIIGDAQLVIVDNISTLVRTTERENDAESWREVGAWALRLRQRGRSALFIHHDGKGGQQRGTSKREDTLDAVIQLKHPADYTPEHGARFEVHFRKQRNSAGEDAKPIEAALSAGADGRQVWTYRTLEDSTHDRVVALARDGLRPGEIAAELGINKSNVSRHLTKARAAGAID